MLTTALLGSPETQRASHGRSSTTHACPVPKRHQNPPTSPKKAHFSLKKHQILLSSDEYIKKIFICSRLGES